MSLRITGAAQSEQPVELEARNVSKAFDPGVPVLAGISFRVRRGESIALIGANGCGKSTLLRCCMHLIRPDGGNVQLFGSDPAALGAAELRRLRARIGFVFQRHNLVPRLSALSNVLHGAIPRSPLGRPWLQGLAPGALREEGLACLARVRLAGVAARRADRLSGGQSQRVAIARALMQRPRMIVADEPVASLDPHSADEVMALFRDLVNRDGLTAIFTSHDLAHALEFADRVIALRGGAIALDAPAATLDLATLRALYD